MILIGAGLSGAVRIGSKRARKVATDRMIARAEELEADIGYWLRREA